jgi:cell division protein FtsI/penicillin-binding protein 2
VTPSGEEPIATGGWPFLDMNNKSQIRRALLLLSCIGVAFAGLAYRLVDLQVFKHDELSAMAAHNTERSVWQQAQRGDILDANGNLLATSIPVKTVWANPSFIMNQHFVANPQALVARVLAQVLPLDEGKIFQQLQPRFRQNNDGTQSTNQYVVLKHSVTQDNWRQIQAAMQNLPALVPQTGWKRSDCVALTNWCKILVSADPEQMRIYPNGALAAQVIGFTRSHDATNHEAELSGCDGIERSFDKILTGVDGWRATEVDRSGHEQVTWRDQDVQSRDGLNVVLTIDAAIQHIVEDELVKAMKDHSPKSVSGLVIRPSTGEILAMATLPTYDPNQPNTISTETRNRVITDIVEPGSTFKIVVVSGALNNGIVQLSDQFNCENGHFAFAGRILHDAEPHGILTTEGIITKSSNIGAAKIGIKLGEQSLYDYAWDYGFGQRTGIPLPGETRGFLYPIKDWSKVSIAQIPMGHGVAVTRLQMAMAMAAIANDGWLMRPMIVSRLQNHAGQLVQQYAPERVRQVISDATDHLMIEALKTVPTKEGTSPGAAMKDYVVAGKTGTAEKAENGAYVPGKYISSFIGFFPADNPQILISIVMDEPKEGHYGGIVCGPVFKDIADRCASYLNIPADPNRMTNAPTMVAARSLNQ